MRKVSYGSSTIEYSVEEQEGLSAHYISVERASGVVLKGSAIPNETADRLILKKAGWIIRKLQIVGVSASEDIVTGSRLMYFGKSYYVELNVDPRVEEVDVVFNYSRFKISVPRRKTEQAQILEALNEFYMVRCLEKIKPRVEKLSARTGLSYTSLAFRKMNKRWGSCSATNRIVLNTAAAKLPWTLIDYLIVHELCHTKVKDHSKMFWKLLSKYVENWRELDRRISELQL